MEMHGMGMHGMDGAMGGWGIFGMVASLISLLFLVGLMALILLLASRFLPGRQGTGSADSAENILRERFARGEIPAEEYGKSMEVLRENPPHKSYEDYIREAMTRLRPGRSSDS